MAEDAQNSTSRGTDSSIAFLAVALEGIEEGAVQGGLPRATARAFLRQALLGTALLLGRDGGSPADLKDRVASPQGTTIAGLAVLEDRGVRGAMLRALELAAGQEPAARTQGGATGVS